VVVPGFASAGMVEIGEFCDSTLDGRHRVYAHFRWEDCRHSMAGKRGIFSQVGTGFLRRAEGMKFNRLKSGELRNRALKMADHMGVTISRVYIVPAGKGHLMNAYGLSNAIGPHR